MDGVRREKTTPTIMYYHAQTLTFIKLAYKMIIIKLSSILRFQDEIQIYSYT